jgi:hypothetical protein
MVVNVDSRMRLAYISSKPMREYLEGLAFDAHRWHVKHRLPHIIGCEDAVGGVRRESRRLIA